MGKINGYFMENKQDICYGAGCALAVIILVSGLSIGITKMYIGIKESIAESTTEEETLQLQEYLTGQGSIEIYTDPDTQVQYIIYTTTEGGVGITPRLHEDGTLYISDTKESYMKEME